MIYHYKTWTNHGLPYILCSCLYIRCILASMAFLGAAERSLLRTISDLAYCNPFAPDRVTLERAALGREFVEGEPVWSVEVEDPDRPRTNVWKIIALLE